MNRTSLFARICLGGSLLSWVVCLISFGAMGSVPRTVATLLALLWVLLSLGSVTVACVLRFLRGRAKMPMLTWGFVLGLLSVFLQVFGASLSLLQQKTEWESASVGGAAFGISFGTVAVLFAVCRILGRIGQTRKERADLAADKEREGSL